MSYSTPHFLNLGYYGGVWPFFTRTSTGSPMATPQSSWHWPQASTVAADWAIWCSFLPCIASNTALGPWTSQPHLLAFVPYDLSSHMAFIASQHHFWTTYAPHQQGPAQQTQMLFPSGISLTLPINLLYTRIHHWSGANLVLPGHSPLLSGGALPLPDWALHCTKSPVTSSHLVNAIQSSTALGLSNSSYMPH